MEYAAPIWDPYYNVDIYKLEKVPRQATQWIQSDYSKATSVTSLLSYIEIPTLEQRCQSSRLILLYKIINNSQLLTANFNSSVLPTYSIPL